MGGCLGEGKVGTALPGGKQRRKERNGKQEESWAGARARNKVLGDMRPGSESNREIVEQDVGWKALSDAGKTEANK